jgi:hypothetical protein
MPGIPLTDFEFENIASAKWVPDIVDKTGKAGAEASLHGLSRFADGNTSSKNSQEWWTHPHVVCSIREQTMRITIHDDYSPIAAVHVKEGTRQHIKKKEDATSTSTAWAVFFNS